MQADAMSIYNYMYGAHIIYNYLLGLQAAEETVQVSIIVFYRINKHAVTIIFGM